MLTDKMNVAFDVNAKFNNILYSLMNLVSSPLTPCNLIVMPTIHEAINKRMEGKKLCKSAAYFLTDTGFYYADAKAMQPVQIEINRVAFATLTSEVQAEFKGLKGITRLSNEFLQKMGGITSHNHFSSMHLSPTPLIPCNLINKTTLTEALHIRGRERQDSKTATYFLTDTEFFYADGDTSKPIAIKLSDDNFNKLNEEVKKEFQILEDIKSLNQNFLIEISEITGHQHYDEKAQDNVLSLYDILLARGALFEEWHNSYYRTSEFSSQSHKQLIAETLNIVFELISKQFVVALPNAIDFSRNESVIGAHFDQESVYKEVQNFLSEFKDGSKHPSKNDELTKTVEQYYNANKDFDEKFELLGTKYWLKIELGRIINHAQERIKRSLIKNRVKSIKPDDAQIYHGSLDGKTFEHYQEIKIESKTLNNDEVFIALGTTRSAVSETLSEYVSDANVRKEFAQEIRESLILGNNTSIEKLYNNPAWIALKAKWDTDINSVTIDNEIEQYCMQEDVYRDYIKHGIGQELPLSEVGIMKFAEKRNLNVYLWVRENKDKMVVKKYSASKQATETIHLLYEASSTHVSVLFCMGTHISHQFSRYDILDTKKMQAHAHSSSLSINYSQSLPGLAKARDRLHQQYSDFDDRAAMIFISQGLDDLKNDLCARIDKGKLFSHFYANLFHRLNFLSNVGNAVVNRTPLLLEQSRQAYNINNRRLSTQLSDSIKKIPFYVRKHLDYDGSYISSIDYMIERVNSFKHNVNRNRFSFFMWSIAQIDYFIKNIKGDDFFNDHKNLIHLINELSNYFELTQYYWDKFEKLHSYKSEDWLSDFSNLIIDNKLQEKLNIVQRQTKKSYDIKECKNKLDKILFTKKIGMQNILTQDNVDVISRVSDLGFLLETAQPHVFNIESLFKYIYVSLYQMDIFQASNEAIYQWVLQLRTLIDLIKEFSPSSFTHNEFIDKLISKLSEAVVDEVKFGKRVIRTQLNMVDIIDIIFQHACKMNITKDINVNKFRENLLNHHLTVKLNGFKDESANAHERHFDELVLAYSSFVKQKFYFTPGRDDFIEIQDDFVNFFEQIKKRVYLTSDNSLKIGYVSSKIQEIKKTAIELLDIRNACLADEDEDNELLIETNQKMKLVNNLYNFIIAALLQGMSDNLVLREAYMREINATLMSARTHPEAIDQLKEKCVSAPIVDVKILDYFINPIFNNRNKNEKIPLPLFLRQILAEHLFEKLNEKSPEHYSDGYLDFLCGLLDGIIFEFKMNLVLEKMKFASSVDLVGLHDAHSLLFNTHCRNRSTFDNLKREIKNASELLGHPNHEVVVYLNKVCDLAEPLGQVVDGLRAKLPVCIESKIKSEDAAFKLLRELYCMDKDNNETILLNILLNVMFSIPEKVELVNGKNISRCYMLNDLERAFLPLHTHDNQGKSLLHKSIELNLPKVALWLIAQGMSVGFEDKDENTCSHYMLDEITSEKYKVNDEIVKAIEKGYKKDARSLDAYRKSEHQAEELSIRIFGVSSHNISFIEGIENIVRNYRNISEPMDKISWAWTSFVNKIARDESILSARETTDYILDQALISVLLGFNALHLLNIVQAIIKEISHQQRGFFSFITRSRLEKDLTAFIQKYLKGVLVAVPQNNIRSARTPSTVITSAIPVAVSSNPMLNNAVDEITRQRQATAQAEARAAESDARAAEADTRAAISDARVTQLEAEYARHAFNTALQYYDILPLKIPADGNCQFKAVEQAYAKLNNNVVVYDAASLRQKTVTYIKNHNDRFKDFIVQHIEHGETLQDKKYSSLDEYLSELEKPNVYGDHLSLQVMSEILEHPIVVLQPSGNASDPVTIRVIQKEGNKTFNFNQALILLFNGHNHYNACQMRGNLDFEWAVWLSKKEGQTIARKVIVQWRSFIASKKSAPGDVFYECDTAVLQNQLKSN